MDKKTKDKFLDIAAELIVSPLAAYARLHEISETVKDTETYNEVKKTAKEARNEAEEAVKEACESEPVQRGIKAVKHTAAAVREGAGEVLKDAAGRMGITIEETRKEPSPSDEAAEAADPEEERQRGSEEEDPQECPGDGSGTPGEVSKGEFCPEDKEKESKERIEDLIEEVDITEIISGEGPQEK